MSDSEDDPEPGEFQVSAVLKHRPFEDLVQLTLDKKYRFLPSTIMQDQTLHSRYGYLVHWEGFPKSERTWEPEENLLDVEALQVYKERHGMPMEHERVKQFYGQKTWRDLELASEDVMDAQVYDYLMTKEERRNGADPLSASPPKKKRKKKDSRERSLEAIPQNKNDKNSKNEKLKLLNEKMREKKENSQKRERILTPPVAEDELRQKRKEEKRKRREAEKNMTEEERAEARRKRKEKEGSATSTESGATTSSEHQARKSMSSTSVLGRISIEESSPDHSPLPSTSTSFECNMTSRPTALPGLTHLDINTPRIQKKKRDTPISPDETTSTPSCAQATMSIAIPQPAVESESADSNLTLKRVPSVIILEDSPVFAPAAFEPLLEHRNKAREVSVSSVDTAVNFPDFGDLVISDDSEEEEEKEEEEEEFEDEEEENEEYYQPMDIDPPADLTIPIRETQWPSEASTISMEEMSIECSENEEDEMTKQQNEEEELAKRENEELEKLQMELSALKTASTLSPRPVEVERDTRPFETALRQRKMRRTQSNEQLSQYWDCGTETELLSKNMGGAYGMSRNEEPIIKKFPKEVLMDVRSTKMLTADEVNEQISNELFKENWTRVSRAVESLNLTNSARNWLQLLTTYYSFDDVYGFKTEFKRKSMSHPSFDPLRYFAIVCMTHHCQHKDWAHDPKGLLFVASDDSITSGIIRHQETRCNEGHRKCLWMEVFMKLLPPRVRFLETSGRSLNGLENDGPFRDDVFFHCMKQGAECQKDLFFKYNKPIGIQEDLVGDDMLDVAHLLAVQYQSAGRFRWYMTAGGLDINALATHMPTKKVMRLSVWLEQWLTDNVNFDEPGHVLHFMRVLETVKSSADALEQLVSQKVDNMITERMNGRFKAHMDLTYPHIIRCSPINNLANGGDGTHQVLSCLFYPQGIGFRDGIYEGAEEMVQQKDVIKLEKLSKVHEQFQTFVQQQKGRVVLAVFRVTAPYREEASNQSEVSVPYQLVESDDGFEIQKMTLLRQKDNLSPEEADLDMYELTQFTSPGIRYYGIESPEVERNFVVPGNAHIELTGEVAEPMSFVAQLFFFRRKISKTL